MQTEASRLRNSNLFVYLLDTWIALNSYENIEGEIVALRQLFREYKLDIEIDDADLIYAKYGSEGDEEPESLPDEALIALLKIVLVYRHILNSEVVNTKFSEEGSNLRIIDKGRDKRKNRYEIVRVDIIEKF